MTLQASGAISLANVNTEMGVSATATRSLNDATTRTLFAVPSGAISLSNGYGKSNRVAIAVTLSANTQNYTLNTAKATGYVAGTSDVTLTIDGGVVVGSNATGNYALTVDTSWAAGDTVTIINNGYIIGAGGGGGAGASGTGSPPATAGAQGGLALRAQRAVSVTNNGTVASGGGGGGGGGHSSGGSGMCFYFDRGAGGGGGAGNAVGAGGPFGAGDGSSSAGSAGTTTAGGTGGTRSGAAGVGGNGGALGAGGGAGQTASSAGGAGGGNNYYIVGNGFVTWSGAGSKLGLIG